MIFFLMIFSTICQVLSRGQTSLILSTLEPHTLWHVGTYFVIKYGVSIVSGIPQKESSGDVSIVSGIPQKESSGDISRYHDRYQQFSGAIFLITFLTQSGILALNSLSKFVDSGKTRSII